MQEIRLRLHSAIYRPDSFVLMLRYCANLKAIRYRYESTSVNRIVADKLHRVIVASVTMSFDLAWTVIFLKETAAVMYRSGCDQ